jgi:glutathione S-transferase
MPKLTLLYFDSAFWRAEMCRLALYIGGVPFEDRRFKQRDDFAKLKAAGEFPFGSVPVLYIEEGGTTTCISQSPSIARYCGKVAGLFPNDPIQAAVIDQVLDSCNDCTSTLSASMREADMDKKMQMRSELASTTLPMWLGYYEALLAKSAGSFFGGTRLSVADLAVTGLCGWLVGGSLDGIPKTLLDTTKFPHLCKLVEEVAAHPKVVEWKSKPRSRL